MNISKKKVRNCWVITIAGELTIYYISECWQKLKTLLDEAEDPVKLNLAKVQDIDTAGLQLIMYLQKYYSEQIAGYEKLSDPVKNTLKFINVKLT